MRTIEWTTERDDEKQKATTTENNIPRGPINQNREHLWINEDVKKKIAVAESMWCDS